MRAVVQRVKDAKVFVNGKIVGEIKRGLLVYLCVCRDDKDKDLEYLSKKIVNMRIFSDDSGKFNLSLVDIEGSCLVVSQFTLAADTKKGNRPSYFYAADPEKAKEFYEKFVEIVGSQYKIHVERGVFGAHMDVCYMNDGPVTIYLDSKENLK